MNYVIILVSSFTPPVEDAAERCPVAPGDGTGVAPGDGTGVTLWLNYYFYYFCFMKLLISSWLPTMRKITLSVNSNRMRSLSPDRIFQ